MESGTVQGGGARGALAPHPTKFKYTDDRSVDDIYGSISTCMLHNVPVIDAMIIGCWILLLLKSISL